MANRKNDYYLKEYFKVQPILVPDEQNFNFNSNQNLNENYSFGSVTNPIYAPDLRPDCLTVSGNSIFDLENIENLNELKGIKSGASRSDYH